jgi:deoxycytidine triphosphate deaminase
MILSNVSIQRALDNKWLVIDPEPAPRRKEGTADCPFQTTAVDLRLGAEIAYFKEGLPISIDLPTDRRAGGRHAIQK